MNTLEQIRKGADGILVLGNHPAIIQSILDFDYLSNKKQPSITGIVSGNRSAQKFFFGHEEILLPCFKDIRSVPAHIRPRIRWMINVQSGRRVYDATVQFFDVFPEAVGGHIFAENVPELHATELIKRFAKNKILAGPSGVGMLVPGHLKLGAIGGIDPKQIAQGKLTTPGSIAIVSTSGGMTNELIVAVAPVGISFSISIGGDRFPVTSLADVLMLAESDPETEAIVYFGELGGVDEYEIVDLIEKKKLTKPVHAYIAGSIDEAFEEHVQFGHAKALVAYKNESARAKRDALRAAGALVAENFPEFLQGIPQLSHTRQSDRVLNIEPLMNRQKSILSTREIIDVEQAPSFVKNKKLVPQPQNAFARATAQALLGKEISDTTAAFLENVLELLIDHGGHVSGAVTTMITARAGKDMVSSLTAGLLTIGPRFGGAVNDAARTWVEGITLKKSADDFVEEKTRGGKLLSGIGHRKYRVGIPDPRVQSLAQFSTLLQKHPHYDFARDVEKVTTGKNGSLILNVDGVMAALLIDLLREFEGYTDTQIQELIDAEFFNALFIIPRTVGFLAHFIEQKKHDEGLFRLPDELLFVSKKESTAEKKSSRRKK